MAAVALATILAATLHPVRGAPIRTPTFCIICGGVGGVDFVLNVLLFAPLGLGLALAGWQARRAFGVVAALTACVELLQLLVVPGRDPSLGDLLANSLGGAFGAALGRHWRTLLRPAPPLAARLAGVGGGAWLVLQLLAGLGMRPVDTGGPFFAQMRPLLRGPHDRFRGQLEAVTLDGVPLRGGPVDPVLEAETRLGSGRARLGATIVTSDTTPLFPAPIVRLVDGYRHTRMQLQQRHDRLVFETRLVVTRARFRTPLVGIEAVFPTDAAPRAGRTCAPGTRVALEGAWVDGAYVLRASGADCGGTRRVALRPSHGWTMLSPVPIVLEDGAAGVSALWLAALLLPCYYWSALAGGRWWPAWTAAVTGAGLLLAPRVAGLTGSAWWEWAAAACAQLLAWALARRLDRRPAAVAAHAGEDSTAGAAGVY